jgi:hypothetical protein
MATTERRPADLTTEGDHARRRYEVRVTGRSSDVARAALAAADIAELAAETVFGLMRHDEGLHEGTASDEQQQPVPLGVTRNEKHERDRTRTSRPNRLWRWRWRWQKVLISTRWSATRPAKYVRDPG